MQPREPSKSKKIASHKFQETPERGALPEMKQDSGLNKELLSRPVTNRQWGLIPSPLTQLSVPQRVDANSLHILLFPFFILVVVVCSHFLSLTHAHLSLICWVLIAALFLVRWLLNRIQIYLRKAVYRLFMATSIIAFVSLLIASINSGNCQRDATNFYLQGQYRKAVDSYNAAFSVIPIYDVREIEERADCYLHLNEYQKAIDYYDMALILQEDNANDVKGKWNYKRERELTGKLRYLRAIAYERVGRADLALVDRQKAKQFGYSVSGKEDASVTSSSGTKATSEKP